MRTCFQLAVVLLDRLGIAQEMKPRLRPMPAEYNVEVVASGEADLVVVVASRISGVRGVEPRAARELLRFFTTPEAGKVLRSTGVEPFVE